MQVKVIKFPVIQDQRAQYVSPLQFVKSSQSSPRYGKRTLTPTRLKKLRRLENSLNELSRHYDTLLKAPLEQETIMRSILSSNKQDRKQMIIKRSQERDRIVKNLVKQKQAAIIESLEVGDPFLEKDQRKLIVEQIAGVEQISNDFKNYQVRKLVLVNKIQDQKYGYFWMRQLNQKNAENNKARNSKVAYDLLNKNMIL